MNAGTYAGPVVTRTAGTVDQVRETAPGATAALVCGILGFFIAGFILGGVALAKAAQARQAIADNPDRYTGSGMATAGTVMGLIDIVGAVIGLVALMAS